MSDKNTIPVDIDRARLNYLLDRLEQRRLTREEAVELQRLLVIERNRAVHRGANTGYEVGILSDRFELIYRGKI